MIAESGYQASLVAQSLRNRRTNVIGVLVADLEPFTAELLKGAANRSGGAASSSSSTPRAVGTRTTPAGNSAT